DDDNDPVFGPKRRQTRVSAGLTARFTAKRGYIQPQSRGPKMAAGEVCLTPQHKVLEQPYQGKRSCLFVWLRAKGPLVKFYFYAFILTPSTIPCQYERFVL
ncbi:MAG: hypothetical protein LBG27_02245, partial [Spirochaetaceae bacterium]|nr:hypothetical protein [Spirochaetaceae bacterium]